ncbi:ROK family transcriptional regulator [Oricola thermophila]|uniref:ROK family transcriptional regulator n=1 Tax=Oricola thermophila TaxID=2742145 RepID=A0A6N1V953_9HYPH|nr:ROK family transcriptional regulator [Oricola thermophila]QKV17486.1 ROK family transcriptional regulator [Oricola thermophila]
MTKILRSDDMRRRNRLRIIQIVRRNKAISRGEIALQAGLSPATVSTISNDLIAEDVLIARGGENGTSAGRGRPSVDLSINPKFRHAVLLILKIGVAAVAIVDYAGSVVARREFDLDMANIEREAFRESLVADIRRTLDSSGIDARQVARIAVGVQGATDIAGRNMLRSPMTSLTDVPVADWLEEEFGVPASLANDCDLIAKALNWRDPERYSDNFAAILLAHGVGMGLFLRGDIINGTQSSGTEFGHMMYKVGGALCRCGSRGCIEANAGDYAILRRYRQEPIDAKPASHVTPGEFTSVANAARDGNPLAREAFAAAGRSLGLGLASIFALVDPFRVVFAGHGAIAFDLMEPTLRETLGNSNLAAARDIPIDLYVDEMPLVFEGCAIGALSKIDAAQADRVLGSAEN